jgi:hypothetical protein
MVSKRLYVAFDRGKRGHHWSQLLEATSSKVSGEQKAERFTALRRHGAKAPQQLATWEAKAWRGGAVDLGKK